MSRTGCDPIAFALATLALHIVVSGSGFARADVVRDGYRSIQVNVDVHGRNMLGDAANEPSIAVDPTDRRKLVIGFRQFDDIDDYIRQAGMAYSRDGGYHWTFPGPLTPGVFGSDPVLDVTAEGVFFYSSLGLECIRLFRSLDGGMTWGDPYSEIPGFDKPWMAIDRTGGPGHGNIYVSDEPGALQRSTDGGKTFVVGVGGSTDHGTIAVDAFGNVFTCSMRSTNARYSDQVPNFERMGFSSCGGLGAGVNGDGLSAQPWIAADRGDGPFRGNVYTIRIIVVQSFPRNSYTLGISRSEDSGVTWSDWVGVTDEPQPAYRVYQWFPMLSVAPNGRVDIVWNDLRNDPFGSNTELYYTYSHDGGRTWAANIPLSPVFDPRVGRPTLSSKLGDYYTMVSDNLGVNIAYAATFNGEQDVYFLRVGPWDCNGNDTPDEQDIASGGSLDANANDIPDDCEVPQDADGNGRVNLLDFAAWQNCHGWTDSRFVGHRPGGGPPGVVVLSPGKGDAADADPLCPRFDTDANGHADLDDFAVFFEEFTRPQGPG